MALSIFDLPEASPADLAALPAVELMRLQEEATANAAAAAKIVNILHGTLAERYARGINATGTHHAEDGGVAVAIVIPKKVKWDQVALNAASETIVGWGENPTDYVDFEIKVSERKYDAWPPAIQNVFAPARTVEQGKPKIELKPLEKEAA